MPSYNPNNQELRFDGDDYIKERDSQRLTGQIKRVWDCMIDGRWRTLTEIATSTRDPEASISAQMRHLRKQRFGSHTIEKRHRGNAAAGLYEYRLIATENPQLKITVIPQGEPN